MLTKEEIQQIKDVLLPALDDSLDRKLKPVKEDIAKIRKDVNAMLNVFDNEYVDLRIRVERLEERINIAPTFG